MVFIKLRKIFSLSALLLVLNFGVVSNAEVRGYSQNDVTVRSDLSVKELESLLPKNMKNLAKTFKDIENSNKPINALFLSSVVRLETGNGTSRAYRAYNNTGGVMGRHGLRSFNSKESCLYYMQDFLYRGYINQGRKSVWRIGSKYCVGGNWAGKVNSIATKAMYQKESNRSKDKNLLSKEYRVNTIRLK